MVLKKKLLHHSKKYFIKSAPCHLNISKHFGFEGRAAKGAKTHFSSSHINSWKAAYKNQMIISKNT